MTGVMIGVQLNTNNELISLFESHSLNGAVQTGGFIDLVIPKVVTDAPRLSDGGKVIKFAGENGFTASFETVPTGNGCGYLRKIFVPHYLNIKFHKWTNEAWKNGFHVSTPRGSTLEVKISTVKELFATTLKPHVGDERMRGGKSEVKFKFS
jgi:hypothetical protein